MSEDDILHAARIERERKPKEEKKEYVSIFLRPETYFIGAACTGVLALMLRRMNKGRDIL